MFEEMLNIGTHLLDSFKVFCSLRKRVVENWPTKWFKAKLLCTLYDDVCFIKWLPIENKYAKII